MSKEKRIARARCRVEDREDHWVDFDVSNWTVREFRTIPEASLDETIERWLEVDSVDWHIKDDDGEPIPHPGRGALANKWLKAYARMPIELARWLSVTPYTALQEACRPSKKRAEGSEDGGAKADPEPAVVSAPDGVSD